MTNTEPSSTVLKWEAICHLLFEICHHEDLTLLAGHSGNLTRESVRYSVNLGTDWVCPLLHLRFTDSRREPPREIPEGTQTRRAPSQIQVLTTPKYPIPATRFARRAPLIQISKSRTERQRALVYGFARFDPLVPRESPRGGSCVPAQGQGGWSAGSIQQNRCLVLPSSLVTAWQRFGKPAIPPWFTSTNRTRPRRRPRPRENRSRGDGTNGTHGTNGTNGPFL